MKLGYQVSAVVASGAQALARVEADRPDLILMDIKLKGPLDGIETAARIRAEHDLPVIYLTAFADQQILERAKVTEPFGYLLKPFEARQLSSNIEMALYKARMERRLKQSQERYRTVADFTYDWETWRAPNGKYLYVSPSCERISGYPPRDFYEDPWFLVEIVLSEDRQAVVNHLKAPLEESQTAQLEFRIIDRHGRRRWIKHVCQPVRRADGTCLGRRATNRDITERKRAEEALKKAHHGLERQVEERTAELTRTNRELLAEIQERKQAEEALRASEKTLKAQSKSLEEVNTALKVLLEHREQEKIDQQKDMLATLNSLVLAYVDKLKETRLSERQQTYLGIIESNLKNIGSSFARRLSYAEMGLTPTELHVANMIQQGKSSKEIADLLCVSTNAVLFHRKSIRHKLGIAKKKVNLQAYLQSLEQKG
ncbi:MAG: response regulator [Deltaproteobacteria bacterium]|nr:response regulator [Deltaproteobacteria bacterium]